MQNRTRRRLVLVLLFGGISVDEVNIQIELLISLLVRFPQIGAVHYEPAEKALRFVFLLWEAELDLTELERLYRSHTSLFYKLQNRQGKISPLEIKKNSQLTIVQVKRGLAGLSLAELKLIVKLLEDYCGSALVQEDSALAEEDAAEENALIESLLDSVSGLGLERLTGFRENGRVLVFSSSLTGVSE